MRKTTLVWVVVAVVAVAVVGVVGYRLVLHKPGGAESSARPLGEARGAAAPAAQQTEVAAAPTETARPEEQASEGLREGATTEEIARSVGIRYVEEKSPAPKPEEPDAWRAVAEREAAAAKGPQSDAEPTATGAETQKAPTGNVTRDSPFKLDAGQEIGVWPAYQQEVGKFEIRNRRLAFLDVSGWRLQGVGGQSLAIEQQTSGTPGSSNFGLKMLWADQPFEVLKDGRLAGRFSNTAEYQQALR